MLLLYRAQDRETQYERHIGTLVRELKDVKAKSDSKSDDMTQFIRDDYFKDLSKDP